jgi:diadenosine tetraphosphatase ApaH/serine/threonine PP2A family protein phosphatase
VRYAILSDIHGNLDALQAVLADAATRTDALICLGDVVGYGPEPEPCLELVGERAAALVSGNHEHGVAGLLDLDWFNPLARAVVEWTQARLDDDHRRYLASLPLRAEIGEATLVHASPTQPDEWEYLVNAEDGLGAFAGFTTRLCFVGHSHRPAVWSLGSWGPEFRPGGLDVMIDAGRRYIINVGSVGQPRDRDSRAAYAVWDVEGRRIIGRRVAYDVAAVRRKIARARLPEFLADRLVAGI